MNSSLHINLSLDKFLLNLAETDEDKRIEPGFTEPRSVFATLLQESDKMSAWNAFLNLTEDDQLAIIANNEIFAYFNNEPVLDQVPLAAVEKIISYRDRRRAMTAEEAFRTLGSKLKSIFTKRHFPMVISNYDCLFRFKLIMRSISFAGNVISTGE